MSNYSENFDGQIQLNLVDPRNFSQQWEDIAASQIQGNANVNGTIICAITIPNGRTFLLFQFSVNTMVNAKLFNIAISDTNGVGGAETLKIPIDLATQGQLVINSRNPIISYNNNTGANRFLIMYMPMIRAALATNNAVGEYVCGSMGGILM